MRLLQRYRHQYKKINGCMQTFSMRHVLICPYGGLVIRHHKNIYDEIIHLAKQDFSPNCVCGEIIIHQGCRISEKEVCHIGSVPEIRGDLSIRGLSEIHMKEIIDVVATLARLKPTRNYSNWFLGNCLNRSATVSLVVLYNYPWWNLIPRSWVY